MTYIRRFRSIYASACMLLGLIVILASLMEVSPGKPVQFALYMLIAGVAALLTTHPPIEGTLPAGYLVLLLGLQELSRDEVLLMACVATVVHEIARGAVRTRIKECLWRLGGAAVSTIAAYTIFHLVKPAFGMNPVLPLSLLMSSMTFFWYGLTVCAVSKPGNVSFLDAYRQDAPWLLPWFVGATYIAAFIGYARTTTGIFSGFLVLPVTVLAHIIYRLFENVRARERQHHDELAALHLRVIETLALTVEAKDSNTHLHLRRVQVYASAIGKELGLNQIELQALHAAAYLHDIGKLAVPEYIISKPGKLTAEEFEKMKSHPIVGGEILARLDFPYPVAPIVKAHHEKWDGTGYPHGLSGGEIPIGARILAAVDCLDALASDRPYRPAIPLDQAMAHVAGEAGKSFDPEVVQVLQRRYRELDKKARAAAPELPLIPLSLKVSNHVVEPAAGLEKSAPEPQMGNVMGPITSARREETTVHELLGELASSQTLDEIMAAVERHVGQVIRYDALVAFLYKGDKLAPVHRSGDHQRLLAAKEIPTKESGLSSWVFEHQKPILNGNPTVEANYVPDPNGILKLESALAVPVEGNSGVIGVVTLYRSNRDAFTRENLRVLKMLIPPISAAIEKTLRFNEAQSSAQTDHLTGIPNGRAMTDHLEREIARASRESASLAILLCDLDGFKAVNDTHGHLKGNDVLAGVAKQLMTTCRGSDYIARIGGDEFVIVMPNPSADGVESKLPLLRRVAEDVGHAVTGEAILSMSIGVAFYPADGTTVKELLTAADREMYTDKTARKQLASLANLARVGATEAATEPSVLQ